MTSFLALIEQQCIDETLMPVDKGTWANCIEFNEAPVKWKLGQIMSVKTEISSRIVFVKSKKIGKAKLCNIVENEFPDSR